MKKGKYIRWIVLVLVVIKSFTLYANEEKEGWINYIVRSVGHKMSNAYRYFFIPHPHLLSVNDFIYKEQPWENEKDVSVLRYDVSRDSNLVTDLRKKLSISGFYIQLWKKGDPTSLMSGVMYEKGIAIIKAGDIKIPEEYRERGFEDSNDNSIIRCMRVLFDALLDPLLRVHGARSNLKALVQDSYKHSESDIVKARNNLYTLLKEQSRDENALIQLLWELESALPPHFDKATDDTLFVNFVYKMEKNSRNVFSNAKYVLSIWKKYTLRFRGNKGLDKASHYEFLHLRYLALDPVANVL